MRLLKHFAISQLSMREVFLLLIFVLLAPVLALQSIVYYRWFESRKANELGSSLELARAAGVRFDERIQGLIREELAIGVGIAAAQPFQPAKASEYLTRMKHEHSYLNSILWATPDGVYVAGSDRRGVGVKITDRDFYKEIRAGRDWAIGNLLQKGRVTGLMVFLAARGIRDEQGNLQGIVVASVDPRRMGRALFSQDRVQYGGFDLYDRQGVLVYREPESDLVGQSFLKKDPSIAECLSGGEFAGSLLIDGRKILAARAPVRGINWVVGVSRPLDEALDPVLRNFRMVMSLMLLVALASAAAALAISQSIIRHLRTLQDHAKGIGQGDFSGRVTQASVRELAELSDAFNHAAELLRERRDEAQRAQGELERSNRELERFAYIASHDLQEPLRMVAGFLQLLKRRYERKLAPEADEFINFAVDGAARMKRLINDLLVFSRVSTTARPLETMDCEAALSSALENLRMTIAAASASVTHDPLPTIVADATQISQVFQNLIANAVKFHGNEKPRIHVSAKLGNGEWIFSVQDNGIGIDPQYFQRIFLIFQRLHDQKEFAGTGLGLAICKKVVERHHGRIWVESKLGKGSVFYFTIPDRMGESS